MTSRFPRPVAQIGWLGVVALAAWIAWAVAGLRSMVLVVITMPSSGSSVLWQDTIDLLIITGSRWRSPA